MHWETPTDGGRRSRYGHGPLPTTRLLASSLESHKRLHATECSCSGLLGIALEAYIIQRLTSMKCGGV